MNLAHLLLRSARWLPEQPAIAVGTRPFLTYAALAMRAARLASGFRERLSLKPGDRVTSTIERLGELEFALG